MQMLCGVQPGNSGMLNVPLGSDFENSRTNMESDPQAGPVIEFREVSYRLPNGRPLLEGLNLEVKRGETLVLLGTSGSGKTTTLKLINRLLRASIGEVRVNGVSIADNDVIA